MAKIIGLGLFVVAFFFHCASSAAAQCDCTHFPWSPDSCVNVCSALVLNSSNKAELETFLRLDKSAAQKILKLKADKPGKSIESLKEVESVLSVDEFKVVLGALNGLKPLEVQYLLANPENKKEFRAMIMSTSRSIDPGISAGPPL